MNIQQPADEAGKQWG